MIPSFRKTTKKITKKIKMPRIPVKSLVKVKVKIPKAKPKPKIILGRSCASLGPRYQKSCNIYAKTGKIPSKLPKRRHMMLSNIFEKKTNF